MAGNKYDGRGLNEEDVDKLTREDKYRLDEARTNRDIKRFELETKALTHGPWIACVLFTGAVVALFWTNQGGAATTLLVSTFTGVGGYLFGTGKDGKKKRNLS